MSASTVLYFGILVFPPKFDCHRSHPLSTFGNVLSNFTTVNRMLRSILSIKLRDKVKNTTIKNKTKAKDVGYIVEKLKFKFPGYLASDEVKWNGTVQE